MRNGNTNYYKDLKRRIFGATLLVPALPFVLVLLIGYRYFTLTLEENVRARMNRVVTDHGHAIETFLGERRTDLELLTRTYEFERISRPEVLTKVFADLVAKSPAFSDLGVFDAQGTQVAYQGPYQLAGRDYATARWFMEVKKRGYFVSDVFLGYRRIPHFVIAVVKREGDSFWIIRATIDTVQFSELVEKVRIGTTGEAFILNKEGLLQTQRRSGFGLLEKEPLAAHYLEAPLRGSGQVEGVGETEGFLWAAARINDGNWLLVVRQAERDAFLVLRSVTFLVILVSLLGGVLIVGLAFYTSNDIIKRMKAADQEKDLLSQQLVVAGRLAEIGEMSAGFAHEVNNPLQIISSEQKLALTTLEEMVEQGQATPGENLSEVLDCLRQVKIQVERCGKITGAILKFARQTEPSVETVDLTGFIPEAVALLGNKAKVSGVALEQELPQRSLRVKGDPAQIQQVLVNLINNALDAVVSSKPVDGGRIVVALESDAEGVRVSVADNGCGITPADAEKIFTPFFTTKPVGEGTGLGLPICFGIVDQMGGHLKVDSKEGAGTKVTVFLPEEGAPGPVSGTMAQGAAAIRHNIAPGG